jgi:hypothetical protein
VSVSSSRPGEAVPGIDDDVNAGELLNGSLEGGFDAGGIGKVEFEREETLVSVISSLRI